MKLTLECTKTLERLVGDKIIWGCDLIEILSIPVKGFVLVKMLHPNDKNKVIRVHINEL